jgi:hypothetical protein
MWRFGAALSHDAVLFFRKFIVPWIVVHTGIVQRSWLSLEHERHVYPSFNPWYAGTLHVYIDRENDMKRHTARPRGENLGDFSPGVRYAAGRQITEATKERERVQQRTPQSFGDKVASGYLWISAAFAAIVLIILITYPIWYPLVTS